jgi:protoporphyrinogen oxidase
LERIDLHNKEIQFTNGRKERYDILINTAPLDMLVQRAAGCPTAVIDAASELVHNSGLIVGLGFSGKRVDPKCWMYFPESNTPFYRVTNFHNYSPNNVPDGDVNRYYSLMCETTYSSFMPTNKETIIEQTVDGLVNTDMINKEDVHGTVSRSVIDVPYSYPVPTIGRDRALAVIQSYLESQSIYSRGRFGAWKYEVGNMDHSFMQGVEVVDRILMGQEERTINGNV